MAERRITYCRICEATCGLVAEVEDGAIVGLAPDDDHVVTKGFACVKGLKQHRIVRSPDRLTTPLKREGDRFVPIPWEQAIAEIGAKLRALVDEHGGDSVGFYLGNPISFSFLPPILASGLMRGLGSKSFFQTGSQDCNNKFAVAERMYGFPFVQPFPDVDRTQCLVIVGSNPAVSKMSFVQLPDPTNRLRAIEQRGGRVILVNPRRTETAKQVGEHVFIRPDTDVFFYLSFLHEVLVRGALDLSRIARFMIGVERLTEVASPYPPERTAEVTGIPADVLRGIVDAYLRAEGAALFSSTGVNQGSHGTLAFWLQEAINAITGNLDRPGGTLVGRGLVEDFPKKARSAGHTMRKDRSRVGGLPSVVDSFPAGILADEILTPGEGKLRALVVMAGNPLLSIPNANGRLEKAMKELELLVTIDLFRNETGDLAHYVLPGLHALERHDLPFVFQSLVGLSPIPYVQSTDPVVAPFADQRDETWILLSIARATGLPLFGSRVADAFFGTWMSASRWPLVGSKLGYSSERLLDLVARGLGQGGLSALRRHPHGKLLAPHTGNDFLGKRVVTDDGRVALAPPEFVEAARALAGRFEEERRNRKRLKLVSKRELTSHNSWMHNHDELVRGRRATNYVYVHPDDARALGLEDGALADVRSAAATIRVPVRVTDEMMPGAVALPHGWGHQGATGLRVARTTSGANVNLLAQDGPTNLEAFSGMAHLTGILVELSPAQDRG